MERGTYAQINYNPDDLDDVSVTEVNCQKSVDHEAVNIDIAADNKNVEQHPVKLKEAETEFVADEEAPVIGTEQLQEIEPTFVNTEEPEAAEKEETGQSADEQKTNVETSIDEPVEEEKVVLVPDAVQDILKKYVDSTEDIQRTLRRLENKFAEEILNGENRDSSVKTMYKELNEYKTGIVEKALKNVLYDIVDIRETMLSQIKYLREKNGVDSISLDEFESYADDMGDILEKHDVIIYKDETGEENVAVRQKIVRKIETEDESLVKKVAESLSYGYEYGSKILYPEKISVYVKKK